KLHLEIDGGGASGALVLGPREQDRLPSGHEDHHGFLEARIEVGKISEVGEVLPVGIDDDGAEPGVADAIGEPGKPRCVNGAWELGARRRNAEVGKLDVTQSRHELPAKSGQSDLPPRSQRHAVWRLTGQLTAAFLPLKVAGTQWRSVV